MRRFAKAQLAAGTPIPDEGALFISVNDRDKPAAVEVAATISRISALICSQRAARPLH